MCACEGEVAQGDDGLVATMFRGQSEKETVVVVIDRSAEEGDTEEESGAEPEGEAIDLENMNVVFVYRDEGGQVVERADFPTPEGEDLRFSGEWVRRVHGDAYSLEVRMVLRADGVYRADVYGERFDSDASERAQLSGEWDARGDDVLMQVYETSNPRLFPKGMLEVLGGGRIEEGVWTFLDSRGIRRTARRVRLEDITTGDGNQADDA